MELVAGKKWPPLVIAAYLALAVTGALTFSIKEFFCFDDLGRTRPDSYAVLSLMVCDIGLPAENTAVIGRAYKYSSPLRNGALRVFSCLSLPAAAFFLAGSSYRPVKNAGVPAGNDTILIKLRI